jgi:thiol-disulfide isomerase/thioredoxin
MRLALVTMLAALSLAAQALPGAKSLLDQGTATTRKYHSFQYTSELEMDMNAGGHPVTMTIQSSTWVENPGRMRVESTTQMGKTVLVADGAHTWMYIGALKQYVKRNSVGTPQGMLEAFGMKLPDASKLADAMRTLRAETIELDGQKHDCWVIAMSLENTELPNVPGARITSGQGTFWLDKTLGFTIRMDMNMTIQGGPIRQPMAMTQKMTLHDIKVDVPLADTLFTFTPPEGSKEVENLGGMKPTDLSGRRAAEFALTALDGTKIQLSALKGKVVLLDFWATWCTPCRSDMPAVSKLATEFKDQGLVVVGVNVGESADTVNRFLKTAPVSYPIALTGEATVVPDYEVTAFPTYVLIGRDGVIAAYVVGGGDGEPALRELLAKAGIKAPK